MSRTLLVLALVALLFAGVLAQDTSSSSTGVDSSSSSADVSASSSSTGVAADSSSSSSAAVVASSSSSTGASVTSSSSSTGATVTSSSSSTGANGGGANGAGNSTVSSSSSSSTGSANTNTSVVLDIVSESVFNQTQQDAAEPILAAAAGLTGQYTQLFWSSDNNAGRRLLAVDNIATFVGVPPTVAQNVQTQLKAATNLNQQLSAATGQTVTGVSVSTDNPDNAASGLSASPLLLAAAAVAAMLF